MLAALRTAPFQLATLFLDSVIKKAEENISPAMTIRGVLGRTIGKGGTTPMNIQRGSRTTGDPTKLPGRISAHIVRARETFLKN